MYGRGQSRSCYRTVDARPIPKGRAMLAATSIFVDGVESWLRAMRADEFKTAKAIASGLVNSGERLVSRPEFIRSFAEHRYGINPAQALLEVSYFFLSATEETEHAVNAFFLEGGPDPTASRPS